MNIRNRIPIARLAFLATTLFGLVCLAPAPACAAKLSVTVTPADLQAHGFSVTMEDREDGTVALTLIRDLSKAKSFPADSGLQVVRYANLRVGGASGLFAQCDVAPDTRNQKNTITYRFTLASDCIAHSRFTLAENHDYKDQTQLHLIGGGTHYGFNLALFARASDGKAP